MTSAHGEAGPRVRGRGLAGAAVAAWVAVGAFIAAGAAVFGDAVARNAVLALVFTALGVGVALAARRGGRLGTAVLAGDLAVAVLVLAGAAYRVLGEGFAPFG